jgi:hypothetical protein
MGLKDARTTKWTYLAIIYIFQVLWHLYEIRGVDGRLQKLNVEMQPERGCTTASTVISVTILAKTA